jgi:tight adherence protein C
MLFTAEYFPLIVAVSLFLSIFLIYMGLLTHARSLKEKRQLTKRIQQKGQELEVERAERLPAKKLHGILGGFSNLMSSLGERAAPKKYKDFSSMRLKFLRAGIRHKKAGAIFWGTKFSLGVLLSTSVSLLALTRISFLNKPLAIGILLYSAFFGFFMPNIWLRIKTARRKEKITKAFPDALDLLVVCVEAGMGMDAAINRVASEIRLTSKELSDEFKLMSLELKAGKSRRDALKNLALRTDLEDVNSLATLLIQADKFGGAISQALRVYSDTFRTKRYQRAEEKAAKIPVKLIFPLILFIFPSLFVVLAGPAAVQVYQYLIQK